MSQDESGTPQIHVDSDWKNQAQAEKDKLKEMDEQAPQAGGERGDLPPAEFKTLVGTLASNAVMSLGGMQHPETGQIMVDMEGAKLYIDLLDVLEEKTKGNLDEEEAEYIQQIAHELRNRFVDFSRAISEQMSKGGMGAGMGDAMPGGGPSPIIQP